MAYDRVKDDYHLTQRGWDSADPRPADAVATSTHEIYQASPYSDDWKGWTQTWSDPNTDPAVIAELYKKFEPPVYACAGGSAAPPPALILWCRPILVPFLCPTRLQKLLSVGAGEGNRTLVVSLGSFCSAIELHPRTLKYP